MDLAHGHSVCLSIGSEVRGRDAIRVPQADAALLELGCSLGTLTVLDVRVWGASEAAGVVGRERFRIRGDTVCC